MSETDRSEAHRVVRVSVASDEDREDLITFLYRERTPTLPLPDPKSFVEALHGGSVYIARYDGERGLRACAGLFPLGTGPQSLDGPPDLDTVLYELACTRVGPTLGGLRRYSMQEMLLSLRIGSILFFHAGGRQPRSVCIVSTVAKSAPRSIRAMVRGELARVPISSPLLSWINWVWAPAVEVDNFMAVSATLRRQATVLADVHDRPFVFRNGPTGLETFRVILDVPWLKDTLPAIRAVAAGHDLGLTQSPPIGLRMPDGSLFIVPDE